MSQSLQKGDIGKVGWLVDDLLQVDVNVEVGVLVQVEGLHDDLVPQALLQVDNIDKKGDIGMVGYLQVDGMNERNGGLTYVPGPPPSLPASSSQKVGTRWGWAYKEWLCKDRL